MLNQDISRILERVAENSGTTVTEVRREIEAAIDSCWNTTDPVIHEKWKAMSPTGSRPTVEEVILYLFAQTANSMQAKM